VGKVDDTVAFCGVSKEFVTLGDGIMVNYRKLLVEIID